MRRLAPLLRKEFEAGKKVASATAYISGIGYYELYLNGKKIGDQVLDPGWTNYKRTIFYASHDVTKEILQGTNAVGVMLGRGNYGMIALDHWWFYREDGYIGQPKLKCRLQIQYEDGTSDDIVSDLSWKIAGGPVIYDCPHMGEIYDATREVPGMEFGMANYDMAALMTKWIDFSWEYNNLADKDGMFTEVLNDWVTPLPSKDGQKPGGNEAIASMNFYLVLERMIYMADLLGKKLDKKELIKQAGRIRNGIQKWCFDEEKAEYHGLVPYDGYIPVLNVMALHYGIVPEEYKETVMDRLIRNITEEKETHLFGGIFAVHSAYDFLPRQRYADLAYKLVIQDTWPSFGNMVKEGATTLWESFKEGGSNIHHFLGSVDNFFYRHLAGINFDEEVPGYRSLNPEFIL